MSEILASDTKTVTILDDIGLPSVMVRIPKFTWNEVLDNGDDSPCSAFIIGGKVYDEIYISKYLNVVEYDRAYSIKGREPAYDIRIDQAREVCRRKGPGWHLMTNAEWNAIALWCYKHGIKPHGNNNYGSDAYDPSEHGVLAPESYDFIPNECRTLTGLSPATWSHDGTEDGIYDLNGNIWDWVSGLRLMNGEIQIIPDNDSALTVDESRHSPLWKAILPDGSLVEPGTPGTYKFDNITPDYNNERSCMVPGGVVLASEIKNPHQHTENEDGDFGYTIMPFNMLKTEEGLEAAEILKKIGLYPLDRDQEGNVFIRNTGERIAAKGGSWYDQNAAGLWEIYMRDDRSYIFPDIGFRCAYVNLFE